MAPTAVAALRPFVRLKHVWVRGSYPQLALCVTDLNRWSDFLSRCTKPRIHALLTVDGWPFAGVYDSMRVLLTKASHLLLRDYALTSAAYNTAVLATRSRERIPFIAAASHRASAAVVRTLQSDVTRRLGGLFVVHFTC